MIGSVGDKLEFESELTLHWNSSIAVASQHQYKAADIFCILWDKVYINITSNITSASFSTSIHSERLGDLFSDALGRRWILARDYLPINNNLLRKRTFISLDIHPITDFA